LTHRSHFRTFSDENTVFLMNNRCKHVSSIAWMVLAVTLYRAGNTFNFCNFIRRPSSRISRSSTSHALRVGAFAQTPCTPRTVPKNPFPRPNRSYRARLAIICSTYQVNMLPVYHYSSCA
jgi:hypothetical protein